MSDKINEKALRYLNDGNVKVIFADNDHARFHVQGSGVRPYYVNVSYLAGWECDCPAHVECAHIVACKHVCDIKQREKIVLFAHEESIFDL